jgi:predicted Fe-Mo cluster-binding NifX family protein
MDVIIRPAEEIANGDSNISRCPNSEAKIGHKFGTSQYLAIVDVGSGNFETVPNPGAPGQRGEEGPAKVR